MTIYGYARISTKKQSLERQVKNIESYNENAIIFEETFTGTKVVGRKEFKKLMDIVKEGDTIKVYVVGVNDAEGKVVLSRKKLVAMESWNKIKEAYESGETLEGKIIKAVKGGVIALTDGSQVFIPARQASGRFVQDLQSLVGTTVNYKIIEIDERRRRVIGSVRVILEAARKEKEGKKADSADYSQYMSRIVSMSRMIENPADFVTPSRTKRS